MQIQIRLFRSAPGPFFNVEPLSGSSISTSTLIRILCKSCSHYYLLNIHRPNLQENRYISIVLHFFKVIKHLKIKIWFCLEDRTRFLLRVRSGSSFSWGRIRNCFFSRIGYGSIFYWESDPDFGFLVSVFSWRSAPFFSRGSVPDPVFLEELGYYLAWCLTDAHCVSRPRGGITNAKQRYQ